VPRAVAAEPASRSRLNGLRLEEITAHEPDFEQRFRATLERLLRALTA
jgi:hypothetical protein